MPTIITNNDYHVFVAPAPTCSKIEVKNTSLPNVMVDGVKHKAKIIDHMEYPLRCMSEYMCYAAYGKSADDVESMLRAEYPHLTPTSNIAFYLCKLVSC